MNIIKPTTIKDRISTTIPTTLENTIIPTTIKDRISTTIPNTIKDRISTTIPTTIKDRISTTIPTTIKERISTTIPTTIKDRISTTIPITNIQTTEPKTIKSNISTIIQKINPTSIIKTSSFKSSSFLSSTINNFLLSSIDRYKENEIIIIQEKSNKTKEEILDNLNEVMKDYNIGKIYEIFGDDYNIKISPINTNSYKDISTYLYLKIQLHIKVKFKK